MIWLLDHEVVPSLRRRLGLTLALQTRTLHAAGVGELWVDDRIQDLEALSDPTVGVLAHPGRVDIRIAVKAASPETADRRIAPIEAELRSRLGPAIFGSDAETLAEVALRSVEARGWRLATLEAGTAGALAAMLSATGLSWAGSLVLPAEAATGPHLARWMSQSEASAGLSLVLRRSDAIAEAVVRLASPEGDDEWTSTYGGPSQIGSEWAATIALDRLRRLAA